MTDTRGVHAFASPTAMLKTALRRYRGRTAFALDGESVTYAALEDRVARVQAVLALAGVGADQPVAFLSRNRWDAWAAASAASALGAPPCWLHPLGTESTHAEQMLQVGPAAIVVDARSFPDRPAQLAEALPGIPIFTLGAADAGTALDAAADAMGNVRLVDLSRPEGIGMVGLTGGTTGKSKAVERSVASVASMTVATLASFDIPNEPRFLAIGPISHVTGTLLLPTLMRGGRVSLVDRFDPETVLARIEREKISLALAVPTMIYDLLDCPAMDRADTGSLKRLLYGGAAMSPHRLAEALEKIGPVFTQLYGQAECHPMATLDSADHDPVRPDILAACGFPTRGCEMRLLDDELNEPAPGEIGEICVRGPGVMTRYRDAPEATEEAFAGGWLHTGDLGRTDEEGRFYIVDRKKEMIVSGGFNIYPREIEDVLTAHPDVATAAVIGLPDPRWGEAAHAVVTLRAGCVLDEAGLADLVRTRKGSMLTPKSFRAIDELPLTAAGKVDKRGLAAACGDGDMQGGMLEVDGQATRLSPVSFSVNPGKPAA